MATKRSNVSAKSNPSPSASASKAPAATPARSLSRDAIAARAYEIWRQSGGAHGHDQADWFRAEQELRAPAAR